MLEFSDIETSKDKNSSVEKTYAPLNIITGKNTSSQTDIQDKIHLGDKRAGQNFARNYVDSTARNEASVPTSEIMSLQKFGSPSQRSADVRSSDNVTDAVRWHAALSRCNSRRRSPLYVIGWSSDASNLFNSSHNVNDIFVQFCYSQPQANTKFLVHQVPATGTRSQRIAYRQSL